MVLAIIAHMFDVPGVDLADLAGVDDAALVGAIEGWAQVEAAAAGRRLAAIAELVDRRCVDPQDPRARWACDDWDAVAAEVGAALRVTHRRASAQMHLGQNLRHRLPKVEAMLAAGAISARVAAAISWRTMLVDDDTALGCIDTDLAEKAARFGALSDTKLERALDACITRYDPDGLRRRTAQRRADALGALAAGKTRLACDCGAPQCPIAARHNPAGPPAATVVIHVLAEEAAAQAARDPNLHGDNASAPAAAPTDAPSPVPVMLGGSALPAPLLAELVHAGATVKRLRLPSETPEPGYRPSAALADFVRMRDMTCRFPGCDVPAEFCDIDHSDVSNTNAPATAHETSHLRSDGRSATRAHKSDARRPRLRLGSRIVTDPDESATQAAGVIADRTGLREHDVAVVLGSGWAPAVAELGDPVAVIPMAELPGFTPPTATGHGGQVLSMRIGAHRVLVLVGRIHAYEGHDLRHVVHPVRTACATGVHTVVLTNAAGGLREDMEVGQPVLISDHLNLTARSPLVGPEFVDLVDAYSPHLRSLAREIDPSLTEGVYAGLPGPHYETPAEIRMLRTLGADLVGMSTVHETIAVRGAGAEVLAVSLVANSAAGMTGEPLSHDDVLASGRRSATRMGSLLAAVIRRL